MVRGIVRPVNFRKDLVFELDELKTLDGRDDMPKKCGGQLLLRLLGRNPGMGSLKSESAREVHNSILESL